MGDYTSRLISTSPPDPVTSPYFWVINTTIQITYAIGCPVTSPYFWVINTAKKVKEGGHLPVTSPYFWVINTSHHVYIVVSRLSLARISG